MELNNNVLHIKSISKSFNGGEEFIVNNLSLTLEKGKIMALVGESGSGKTTLIRLIAGLETIDFGRIELNNTVVASDQIFVSPEQRNIGMVFQDYALFPHLTVFKNVAYGISKSKTKKQQVEEVLLLVGLNGFEHRYPHQLSGGQQQRVAIARAIVGQPSLLIFDEPFSNLDVNLRIQLRNEIFDIIKKTKVTAIFVTHDTQDAMAIADEIIVLKQGNIIQRGTAKELYNNSVNYYVASLFNQLVMLSNLDLECFGFYAQKNTTSALRLNEFILDENCDFSLRSKITKSQFFKGQFLNTLKLQSESYISFYSKEDLTDKIVHIGFNKKNLLVFDS
tara:strand:- start:188 stop:1192 length:1005 start_codon:yes stop_codon:yes gene_type:complete